MYHNDDDVLDISEILQSTIFTRSFQSITFLRVWTEKSMLRMAANDIQMDFLEVCSFGDLEKATTMLKNGEVDRSFQHHSNGWTALHWAARRNHQEIVELLLQAGFDPKSPAKDGRTPLDLVTSKVVKEILTHSINTKTNEEGAFSVDIEIASFRIVGGKECFKRIALPACDSVNVLKLTIERAMKKGKVVEVITLPDKMKIETDDQIRNLANHQKIEVIFNSSLINMETSHVQELSPNEVTVTHSRRTSTSQEKLAGVVDEYLNEPASYDGFVDDIISLGDTSNCINVDDSSSRMKDSDLICKDQPKISEVVVTTECFLTAQPSNSITDIILPSKILAEEIIKLQVISSQENNDEIDPDKSVQILKAETKGDYKLAESESMVGTESVILSLLPKVDLNGRLVCYITESNCFTAAQDQCHGIVSKNISRRRTLQIALFIGCVVGFGGCLTYMLCKK
uniref:ANK_REP_REGION domain-containing protein n=1 Tax=Elaeophora elaphi TaxID=1147741 RepID=A0A158Q790_9BILA